jgi:hypothetical protein
MHINYCGQRLTDEERETVTSVTISPDITVLPSRAFQDCKLLTNVEFPQKQDYGCKKSREIKEDGFYGYTSPIKNIIPHGVTIIGDAAFELCPSLKRISIPDSVKDIGPYAFSQCSSLVDVNLPDNIQYIHMSAFYQCESLVRIKFPDNLKEIEEYAFCQCESLTRVDLPKSMKKIGRGAFYSCSTLSFVKIPGELEYIGDGAFEECKSLCKVYLPRRLLHLGKAAFYKCSALTHIHLPTGLKKIARLTFFGCKSLVAVCIPSSVETIYAGSFVDCTSLLHVYNANSCMEIRIGSFAGCTSLSKLYQSINPQPEHFNPPAMREIRGIVGNPGLMRSICGTDGEYEERFHDWIKHRYDSYPFLKKCGEDNVSMNDIQQIIDEHGVDCLLQVEEGTGINGFDLILSNPSIEDTSFELIVIMIFSLLGGNW